MKNKQVRWCSFRTKNFSRYVFIVFASCLWYCLSSCVHNSNYYTKADFTKTPKIDVHIHYNTYNASYLKFADSLNFRLVSPNVDLIMVDEQLEGSHYLKQQFPDKFAFWGTFSVDNFGKADFIERTIARIDKCMEYGALGIKIWKNIGMVLKDSAGHFVMADDPVFEKIFKYMEDQNIPVMAHLGEPKNCWLHEDQMTINSNRAYYKRHPEYYMYLHPDAPSYQTHINTRDTILSRYSKLRVVGAHLGSLEWSVDEIAKRFDQFSNFDVDISARIGHLQFQSLRDREKVRNFLIKYQYRVLYGTDMDINDNKWMKDWLYLATDSIIEIKELNGKKVKGLQLPRSVIDKIYCKNAERYFK